MSFEDALARLVASATSPDTTSEQVERETASVLEAARQPIVWEPRIETLFADGIAAQSPVKAGCVALAVGALVERGADPRPASRFLLPHAEELAAKARPFFDACMNEMTEVSGTQHREDGDEEDEYPEERFQAIGERLADVLPAAAIAWDGLAHCYLAVVAVLSRDTALRREWQRLLPLMTPLAEFHGGADWIARLLRVLDNEPVLVLEPARGRGLIGTISGVADNFQLHMLLMDALPAPCWWGLFDDGRLPPHLADVARGIGPAQIDGHVSGRWDMLNWQAVDSLGRLPELGDSQFWIWNEGIPSDIAIFDGRRVIVLAPPTYHRGWNASRLFGGLKASLDIEERISSREVERWTKRLAQAPRPSL